MSKEIKDEIIFGKNNVIEALNTREINKCYILKERSMSKVTELLKQKNIPFVFVDKLYLNKLTKATNHQGVAVIASPIKYLELNDVVQKNKLKDKSIIFILDEVQDPNNLGAIIRIADCFNIDAVIFNKRRNAQINSSVSKASTGAIHYVDVVRVNNIKNTIKSFKKNGYWVGFLSMDGEVDVSQVDYNEKLVIVIGGEDKGVTENIKKECDFGININISGHVNSLNVASATSIIAYESSKI